MWWENCLCKGRAGLWAKLVICGFFPASAWTWPVDPGRCGAPSSWLHFIPAGSQWARDLQCLAGNSAGFFQPLHKPWNHVPVLGAPAVLDHEIPIATRPLWNIRLLVFWPRVALLGRHRQELCRLSHSSGNAESKLSHTTSHYVHHCFHILRWKSVFIAAQEPFRLGVQPLPFPWTPGVCQEPSADSFGTCITGCPLLLKLLGMAYLKGN